MRVSRPMTAGGGQSRALVAQTRSRSVVVRNSDLAVIPPRRVPITLKARRSFARLTFYCGLAAIFAFGGYAYHDTGIRRAVDYELTMLTTPGVSSIPLSYASHIAAIEPLPAQAQLLFGDSQKGPRADKFAYALKTAGNDSIARRMKTAPLHLSPSRQCRRQPLRARSCSYRHSRRIMSL